MRFCQLIFFFILITESSFAQINQEWVKNDIDLIDSVKKLNKQNPEAVEAFFVNKKNPRTKINLGFGWSTFSWPVARSGGYTSVYANLYYFHDSLTSYILECHLPDDSLLWRRYMELYWDVFTPDSNAVFYYDYHEDKLTQPVEDVTMTISGIPVTQDLLNYMSPLSGIVYGNRGGIANSVIMNREVFNNLKNKLSYEQLILLMHSVNPASRFTAAEYYLRYKKHFQNNKKIDAWIEKLYTEVPEIETMSGCIGMKENSRELVIEYSRWKHDPE